MPTSISHLYRKEHLANTKKLLGELISPADSQSSGDGRKETIRAFLYEKYDRLILINRAGIREIVTISVRGTLEATEHGNITCNGAYEGLAKKDEMADRIIVPYRGKISRNLPHPEAPPLIVPEHLQSHFLEEETDNPNDYYLVDIYNDIYLSARDQALARIKYNAANQRAVHESELERLTARRDRLEKQQPAWHEARQRLRRRTLISELDAEIYAQSSKLNQIENDYKEDRKEFASRLVSRPPSIIAYSSDEDYADLTQMTLHTIEREHTYCYVFARDKTLTVVGTHGLVEIYPISNSGTMRQDRNTSFDATVTLNGVPVEALPDSPPNIHTLACFVEATPEDPASPQANAQPRLRPAGTRSACTLSNLPGYLQPYSKNPLDPRQLDDYVRRNWGESYLEQHDLHMIYAPPHPVTTNAVQEIPAQNGQPEQDPAHKAEHSSEQPSQDASYNPPEEDRSQTVANEAAFSRLESMVGLDHIKQEVATLANVARSNKLRQSRNLPVMPLSLHLAFTGNPGTGKTEVARQLGIIYKNLGILEKGHLVEVSRKDLVGQHVGHTAAQTQTKIDEARGGVLFIDEAYTLTPHLGDSNDFGSEAIDTLLKAMEDDRESFVLIAAGYPSRMTRFLNSNPGLSSRFAKVLSFPDYRPSELLEIFEQQAIQYGYELTESALKRAGTIFEHLHNLKDETFGNARDVRTLIEGAAANQANRLATNPDPDHTELVTLTEPDLPNPAPEEDEEDLKEALAQLEVLIGLEPVKEQIRDLVNFMQYRKIRLAAGMSTPPPAGHLIFSGNPGTGKTTVARILSKIYATLGILKHGHLVETDRSGLVAGYVGQTALKVKELVQSSLGGALFIDEAYSIAASHTGSDFGSEAVDTLVKEMEDRRENLLVIAAGYPDEMQAFIDSNPGLRSRFTKKIDFPDYSPGELFAILLKLSDEAGYHLTPAAQIKAAAVLDTIYENRNCRGYGNGREARKLFEAAIAAQASRLASEAKDYTTPRAEPHNDPDIALEGNQDQTVGPDPVNPITVVTKEDINTAATSWLGTP